MIFPFESSSRVSLCGLMVGSHYSLPLPVPLRRRFLCSPLRRHLNVQNSVQMTNARSTDDIRVGRPLRFFVLSFHYLSSFRPRSRLRTGRASRRLKCVRCLFRHFLGIRRPNTLYALNVGPVLIAIADFRVSTTFAARRRAELAAHITALSDCFPSRYPPNSLIETVGTKGRREGCGRGESPAKVQR